MTARKRDFKAARFLPHLAGSNQVLGELESQVMEVLWERGRSSVRDVLGNLSGGKKLAYTTVMTVMSRLAEKGLLEREKDGASYFYRPALTKEEFSERVAQEVLSGILSSHGDSAVASFVDLLASEGRDKLEYLSKLLHEKQRGRRKE